MAAAPPRFESTHQPSPADRLRLIAAVRLSSSFSSSTAAACARSLAPPCVASSPLRQPAASRPPAAAPAAAVHLCPRHHYEDLVTARPGSIAPREGSGDRSSLHLSRPRVSCLFSPCLQPVTHALPLQAPILKQHRSGSVSAPLSARTTALSALSSRGLY